MSEPLSLTPGTAEQAEQLALPGAKEMFEAVGLADLPVGAADLSKRQLEFCRAYLETASEKRAAEIAGYGDPEAHASKIKKNPKVAAFLAKALARVSANADKVIERLWQRSVSFHEELMRLRPDGKSTDWKKERELAAIVNQTDAALGVFLVKLNIKIEGTVNHEHSVLTPEVRAEILKMQDQIALRQQERRTA